MSIEHETIAFLRALCTCNKCSSMSMCQLFLEGRGMTGLGLTFIQKDQYQTFGRFGLGSYSSVLAVSGRICDQAFA